ncbi:hypothetical protein [Amycolatopsis minnesotensis]|uniref:DUF5753 domain-containing protein n=1 Tax=Amycolatopsis minnesotensis TaxID=337894 RepID=A0ABN2R0E4_9PSEU
MGYRERRVELIATRAAPHLEPGEQIQTGFIAQTGSLIFTARVWTIIVTDRAILVVRGGRAERFRRDVLLGAPTGMYHSIELDRAYRVHKQYFQEIAAADEALREMRSRDDSAPGDS